jgi:hypothetical protein
MLHAKAKEKSENDKDEHSFFFRGQDQASHQILGRTRIR